MHIEKIEKIFKGRIGKPLGKYKRYGVMILLYNENGEDYIIFEKRALTLRSQPGDICFPGGRIEEGETPLDTAIRETVEELNVKLQDINYIGEMDYFISPYNTIMYPFVASINYMPDNFSRDEVHTLFKVPVKYFIENPPILYEMHIGPIELSGFPFHLIEGGENYNFSKGYSPQYFYEYDNYVIWGFTARIIKEFIDLIK